ncbi:unnamed protein product, partial [Pylaiella littoralis]
MRFLKIFSVFFHTCITKVSAMFVAPQQAVPSSLTEQHLKAAKLCRDVYSDAVETADTFVESKDTGAQATVTLDGTKAIVCFRGTNCLTDWAHNLKMCRVPFLSRKHTNPELGVHSGFFIGHNSVKAKIYAKLNDMIKSGKCDSILFAGHSAGVISAISAFDFQNDRNIPIEVVTFGAPKVGNAAFAAAFNSRIKCTRIVNDNDGIAHAPLFTGYRHVGRDVIQLRDTEPAPGGQKLWQALVNFARLDSLADHGIDNYIYNMEECLKK